MRHKCLLLVFSLFVSVFRAAGDEMTEAELLCAIRERPARACSGYCTYEAPLKIEDTAPPKGYKPFYVSHLSRHGSRYHGSVSAYSGTLKVFRAMKDRGCLTAKGDSLYSGLLKMAECTRDHDGLLTALGKAEHFGIGGRLCRRFPEIFRDRSRNVVHCSSTTVQRCIQSMVNFTDGVRDVVPGVAIDYNVGLAKDFADPPGAVRMDKREEKDFLKKSSSALVKKQMALLHLDALADRLFTDRDALEKEVGDVNGFLYSVYLAAADQFCLGTVAVPLSFFTCEELLSCWKVYNIHHATYGVFSPLNEYRIQKASGFARKFVEEADEAIAGNGRCADLRFGHDGNIGPFLALLACEGWDKTFEDDIHLHWQGWRYLSMGTNVQFVFYRNRSGEVLVKILRNEKETLVPALRNVDGPYYKWSELRPYILGRAGTAHRQKSVTGAPPPPLSCHCFVAEVRVIKKIEKIFAGNEKVITFATRFGDVA